MRCVGQAEKWNGNLHFIKMEISGAPGCHFFARELIKTLKNPFVWFLGVLQSPKRRFELVVTEVVYIGSGASVSSCDKRTPGALLPDILLSDWLLGGNSLMTRYALAPVKHVDIRNLKLCKCKKHSNCMDVSWMFIQQ